MWEMSDVSPVIVIAGVCPSSFLVGIGFVGLHWMQWALGSAACLSELSLHVFLCSIRDHHIGNPNRVEEVTKCKVSIVDDGKTEN